MSLDSPNRKRAGQESKRIGKRWHHQDRGIIAPGEFLLSCGESIPSFRYQLGKLSDFKNALWIADTKTTPVSALLSLDCPRCIVASTPTDDCYEPDDQMAQETTTPLFARATG